MSTFDAQPLDESSVPLTALQIKQQRMRSRNSAERRRPHRELPSEFTETFDAVMECYAAERSPQGSLVSYGAGNTCVADYRADCDLAFRAALPSNTDRAIFLSVWVFETIALERVPKEVAYDIRTRVGKELRRRGLGNIWGYFSLPIDLEKEKKVRQR